MFVVDRLRALRMLSLGVVGVLLSSATVIAAAPAHAVEVYPRPLDGTVKISGRGFGHGHGMSQWGAYGAATVGNLSWQSILAFYYPGTQLSNLGNPTIRVRLDAVGSGNLFVFNAAGLKLAGQALPAAGITQYRTRSLPATGRVQVDALWSTGWRPYRSLASPAVFSGTSGIVAVKLSNGTRRTYRGSVYAHRATSTTVKTVSVLPMESYLRAVVPAEMPASWHPNALRAQAVAARSYANYDRAHAVAGRSWDTCDTTSCQMYSGVSAEYAASSLAVATTAGQTLTYLGRSAFTQFSAANGGWTSAGGQPYLIARADPYDGAIPNNANTWTASLTAAAIQARWPSIGTFLRLRIISRAGNGQWGGNVVAAAIDGSSGSVAVTGATIRWAFGLKSDWFVPTNVLAAPGPPVASSPTMPWAATRYTPFKKVVLKQGSSGAAVVVLQRGLKVTPDGAFGPNTRAKLLVFQKAQRISPNGVVSQLVWNRLEKRDYPLIGYRGLTVKQGSRGPVVVAVQRALSITADGDFGPKTAAAVRAVQSRAKLAQTGVVSGWTWVRIENRMHR